MSRRRTASKGLPRYLYGRSGYYAYRNPTTREEIGLGRARASAIAYAVVQNAALEKSPTASQRLANGETILLSREEILRGAVPANRAVGVYFLIQGSEIVYVGQSRDGRARVASHLRAGLKAFDLYYFQECDLVILDELEATYIDIFKPKHNRATYPHLVRVDALQHAIQYSDRSE